MYKTVKAKSSEEAIKNSGMFVGQLAEVVGFKVHGSTDGVWSVIPEFKLKEGQPNAQDNQNTEPQTVEESVKSGFHSK